MARPKRYYCKDIIIAFGPRILSGYGEDSFLEIAPSGEGVQKSTGCDGETTRSLDPDKTFHLTLTLKQTSDDVSFLQRRYDMDRETSGLGSFPILVRNKLGGEIFSASDCWVANSPTHGYGKTAGDVAVEMDTGEGTWLEV